MNVIKNIYESRWPEAPDPKKKKGDSLNKVMAAGRNNFLFHGITGSDTGII